MVDLIIYNLVGLSLIMKNGDEFNSPCYIDEKLSIVLKTDMLNITNLNKIKSNIDIKNYIDKWVDVPNHVIYTLGLHTESNFIENIIFNNNVDIFKNNKLILHHNLDKHVKYIIDKHNDRFKGIRRDLTIKYILK